MPASRWVGPALVFLFVLFDAVKHVFVGSRTQGISPALLTFSAFLLVALLSHLLILLRPRHRPGQFSHRDLIWLNIFTAAAWTCLFHALKYLEPAIVGSIVNCTAPLIVPWLDSRLRRQRRISWQEWLANTGIVIAALALFFASARHWSGIPAVYSSAQIWLGIGLTLLTAVAGPMTLVFVKRMTDQGCSPTWLLAHRFYLLVPLAGLLMLAEDSGTGGEWHMVWPDILITALVGVLLPIFVIQHGVRLTEPVVVALIISLSPLVIFAVQWFDPRLTVSPATLAGVAAITLLVGWNVALHNRGNYADLPHR